MIRIYADCAQEADFNKIETIFAEEEASKPTLFQTESNLF
jgi:hypothetical protein